MNAKGGVGKSTLTMALAETLSAFHRKRVLAIDSDGQMSLSVMMLPMAQLTKLGNRGKTITGFLTSLLPGRKAMDWRECVAANASDVDDAQSVSLIAGDMDLVLVEREIVASGASEHVRESCKMLLREAEKDFDLVLADCAPGISVMTECWLRECDWHLIPVRPDILALSGIQYLKNFRQRTRGAPFARHLGVAVNMKQPGSETDETIHELLLSGSCADDSARTEIGALRGGGKVVPEQISGGRRTRIARDRRGDAATYVRRLGRGAALAGRVRNALTDRREFGHRRIARFAGRIVAGRRANGNYRAAGKGLGIDGKLIGAYRRTLVRLARPSKLGHLSIQKRQAYAYRLPRYRIDCKITVDPIGGGLRRLYNDVKNPSAAVTSAFRIYAEFLADDISVNLFRRASIRISQ